MFACPSTCRAGPTRPAGRALRDRLLPAVVRHARSSRPRLQREVPAGLGLRSTHHPRDVVAHDRRRSSPAGSGGCDERRPLRSPRGACRAAPRGRRGTPGSRCRRTSSRAARTSARTATATGTDRDAERRDQVRQLRVEVRMLRQQEQRLVDPRQPAVGDDHAEVPEVAADVVEHRGPAELELRVDPGRARLMDHHRDAELLRLLVDGERDLGIVRCPVLYIGYSFTPASPSSVTERSSSSTAAVDALIRGVHRREPDEPVGVGPDHRGDRSRCTGPGAAGRRARAPRRVDRADQPCRRAHCGDTARTTTLSNPGGRGAIPQDRSRPPLARVAARLPLRLGGQPMRRKQSHAPVDAERTLPPVRQRELRVSARLRMWLCASMITGGILPSRVAEF